MLISNHQSRKFLLLLGVLLAVLLIGTKTVVAQEEVKEYVCTPCGCKEDNTIVHKAGKCGTCGMPLINLNDINEGIKYTNIRARELCKILDQNPDIILLDVRSPEEFEAKNSLGRFKNAINFPITQARANLSQLEKYKDKEIIIYCSISARSPRVSELLANNGFNNVKNLMGGLNSWQNQSISELPCKDSSIENK